MNQVKPITVRGCKLVARFAMVEPDILARLAKLKRQAIYLAFVYRDKSKPLWWHVRRLRSKVEELYWMEVVLSAHRTN